MSAIRNPIILDMDPGVDDALGILLAMRSPDVDVKAITICGGNVALDQCAFNALKTLRIIRDQDLPPVALGAFRPLSRAPFRASGIHGPDGLGNVSAQYPNPAVSSIDRRSAVDLMLETIKLSNDPITIVATAPLTNIAHAISRDPETMRQVKEIVWMGGAFAVPGNISSTAEFNAFCDPHAAAEAFAFGIPITVVGLDVCLKCPLTRQDLGELVRKSPNPATEFAWAISQMYMDFYAMAEGFDGCFLHDPLAVGLAIWPDLIVEKRSYKIDVVTDAGPCLGMTLIDRRPRNPWSNSAALAALDKIGPKDACLLRGFGVLAEEPVTQVVTQVDSDEFLRRFIKSLS